jgi:hypothetical protein
MPDQNKLKESISVDQKPSFSCIVVILNQIVTIKGGSIIGNKVPQGKTIRRVA